LNRTIIIDRFLIIGKEGGENNKRKQERADLEADKGNDKIYFKRKETKIIILFSFNNLRKNRSFSYHI